MVAGTRTMHSLNSVWIALGRKPSSNNSSMVASVSAGDKGSFRACIARAIMAICSESIAMPVGN